MHIKHQLREINHSSLPSGGLLKDILYSQSNQVNKTKILTTRCQKIKEPKVKVHVPPFKGISPKPECTNIQPTSRRSCIQNTRQKRQKENFSWSTIFASLGGVNKKANRRSPQKTTNRTYHKEDQLYRHRVKMKRQMFSLPSPPQQEEKKVPEQKVQGTKPQTSEVRKREFKKILGSRKGSLVWRAGEIEKQLDFMLADNQLDIYKDAEVNMLKKELTDSRKMIRQLDVGVQTCAKFKNKESIEIHQELIIEAEEYVAAYNKIEPDSYIKEGKTRRRFRLKQDKQNEFVCPNCTFKGRTKEKVGKHVLDIHRNIFENILMRYGGYRGVSQTVTKNTSNKKFEKDITVEVDVHPIPVNKNVFYDAIDHPVPAEAPVKPPHPDKNDIEVIEVVQMNLEDTYKHDPRGAYELKKPNRWSRFKQVREINIHTL